MTSATLQRTEALSRANTVRFARAKVKRELAQGQSPIPHIVRPPAELRNAAVWEILRACRHLGAVKLRKVLAAVPMSEHRTFAELTDRQKVMLVRALRETVAGRDW